MNTIRDIILNNNLSESLIIGYYGGGNFGDELLLSILLKQFSDKSYTGTKYYYLNPKLHNIFQPTSTGEPIYGKKNLILAILKSKNIIIGGGGHWGLDANLNTLFMSTLLFFARFILRKNIYLLGVGFYDSTPMIGRISGFLAGKAASVLIARDSQSFNNFKKINNLTILDRDIAYLLENNSFLEKHLVKIKSNPISCDVLLILRRLNLERREKFQAIIEECIKGMSKTTFSLLILEPEMLDKESYNFVRDINRKYENTNIVDGNRDPFEIISLLYGTDYKIIAPQYHIQLVGSILNLDCMPIYYDKKVLELLKQQNKSSDAIPIEQLTVRDLESFVLNA